MREGMHADYKKVNERTQRIYEVVHAAKSIHVTSHKGTEMLVHFDEKLKWVPLGGLYHEQGKWGNLPEGEVATCPGAVDGIFVAEVLGDYFSAKYGILSQPLAIEIVDGRVKQIKSGPQHIAVELMNYLDSAENGRRVGEFAIGTNIGIKKLCGNLLQDEKIPGVHIAFGDPLGSLTGADWSSKVHVDHVNSHCSIEVDEQLLMKEGHFT
jgi:aminopeptidase